MKNRVDFTLCRIVALCALAVAAGCGGVRNSESGAAGGSLLGALRESDPSGLVTNTVVAFSDNAVAAIPGKSFNVRPGEVQAIVGGAFYARPTMAGFTKTGMGTLLVNSPVEVKGLGDVQAGTLKIAKLFAEGGASVDEMIAGMPIFSKLRFARGATLDLSDNVGFLLEGLVGGPAVVNAGVFGLSGKWTLTAPDEVLTVKGEGATLSGESYAGQLAFAEGSEFDFQDAAAEAAFEKAVTAAGAAGLVVARADWVYADGATLGDVTLVMPKPSDKTSKRWSMRAGEDNLTVRLFLAKDGN